MNDTKLKRWTENGETVYGTEEEMLLAFSSDNYLFKQLDTLVINKDSNEYILLKKELQKRIKRLINPFKAGRPKIYSDEIINKVKALRKQGKTIREISKETGISTGKISMILHGVH